MGEGDDIECVGECNYVVAEEKRAMPDGSTIAEAVERCTGCGRVITRTPLDPVPPRPGPAEP